MKPAVFCILLLALPQTISAQSRPPQQGTIIRMRMADCLGPQHPLMAAMSGSGIVEPVALCPEYVLLTDNVAYVIVGKTSDQLLPLAETTRFHFQKNEMLIRVDDTPKVSRFHIKAMMLRPEWDRDQKLEEAEASAMINRHLDPAVMRERQ